MIKIEIQSETKRLAEFIQPFFASKVIKIPMKSSIVNDKIGKNFNYWLHNKRPFSPPHLKACRIDKIKLVWETGFWGNKHTNSTYVEWF